jgi:hypothetical protein
MVVDPARIRVLGAIGEPRSRTDFATVYVDPEEPPDST